MPNQDIVPVSADSVRNPTFIMLADMFDKAGINYNNTALEKIEPLMLEFLVEFSAVTTKYVPRTPLVHKSRFQIENEVAVAIRPISK